MRSVQGSVSRVPPPVRCRYFSGACLPAHRRRHQLTLICRIPAVAAVISGDGRLRCVLRHHAGFRQVSTQRALHTLGRSFASVKSQSLAKLGHSVLGCRVSAKQEGNAVTTDLAVARNADRSRRVFVLFCLWPGLFILGYTTNMGVQAGFCVVAALVLYGVTRVLLICAP